MVWRRVRFLHQEQELALQREAIRPG